MNPSFREILRLLSEYEVEFVVVGGVAAVIHGAPVTTFDLDTLVRVSKENAQRLAEALQQLNARYREHETVIHPSVKDLLAGGHLLLMTRAGPLDVLGYIGHRSTYEDLLDSTVEVSTDTGTFRVLSLDELIRQKRATNRSKDRVMLEILERLAKRRDH